MKDYVKINRNKQQQQNRIKKITAQTAVYNKPDTYKIFTVIHLAGAPVNIDLNLPYNFILHATEGLSTHDLSYLARCSDLLLLTVASAEVDQALISLIKRYMPTAIVVFDRKNKGVARGVAKSFGDIKICEASMLSMFLAKASTANTSLCKSRPFMVARDVQRDGEYLYLEGFMKSGLRSDKVIMNGMYEGIIEDVVVDDERVPGSSLNFEEDERLIVTSKNDDAAVEYAENQENQHEHSEEEENEDEDTCSLKDIEYEGEEAQLDPEYDLVNKYEDYRGIVNLATCTFRDQDKPAHYKDLIFMKNMKYAQNSLLSKKSIIPPNKFVRLKIKVCQEINERLIVLFNLFEFETRNTVHNYEFSCRESIGRDVVVDNGYRVFRARTILSKNMRNNVFQEEPTLDHGVVSFVGPFSFYSSVAHLFDGDRVVKLLNGESQDRVFFDCVELRGRPVKIYKHYCVVRGMFYAKEQVEYFGNLRIEARNGNQGFIKKALGTKGLFKAYFNNPIKHDDTIKMSLYKRVFL